MERTELDWVKQRCQHSEVSSDESDPLSTRHQTGLTFDWSVSCSVGEGLDPAVPTWVYEPRGGGGTRSGGGVRRNGEVGS